MIDCFLKCRVYKGMFSDEVAVAIRSTHGQTSFFVQRDCVRGELNGEGEVRIRLYRDGATAWAIIPDENQTSVTVHDRDVVAN